MAVLSEPEDALLLSLYRKHGLPLPKKPVPMARVHRTSDLLPQTQQETPANVDD